jgi:hypothetical protein
MLRLSQSELQALRRCVRSDISGMPDDAIEQALDESLAELSPPTTEDFLKTLGSLGKAVTPTLERAAPSIVQGATTGATVGGPWGALIGAGVGLASSATSKPGTAPNAGKAAPPVAPSTAAPTTPTPSTGAVGSTGATPFQAPTLPAGQSAAATVLALLDNPVIRNSLLSQVLGSAGTQQVQTPSGVNVPRAAINSLLTQLLASASEQLPESESVIEQDYLLDETGEYIVDPAAPEQHAALVLSYLHPPQGTSTAAGYESEDFSMEEVEWALEDSDESEAADWNEFENSEETVEFF